MKRRALECGRHYLSPKPGGASCSYAWRLPYHILPAQKERSSRAAQEAQGARDRSTAGRVLWATHWQLQMR